MLRDQALEWQDAKKHGRLVAKAWADPAFKERLLAHPAAVLREQGFDVPAGIEVRVVEDAESTQTATFEEIENVFCVALPARPALVSSFEQLTAGPAKVFNGICNCGCAGPPHCGCHGPHCLSDCSCPPCVCDCDCVCPCGCDSST
jgi:hypothetical protein